MLTDYHTHTPLCHHAEGSPKEYVTAALAAGLSEYGISDHAPHAPEPFDDWRMAMADLPQYLDWIAEAQSHAGGKLIIYSGLECDWLQGCESHTALLKEKHDWDYLIGSVHYLPGRTGQKWDFDNPAHLSQWMALTSSELEDLWTLYWKEYEAMIRSRLFTFGGHPDLIKKFAFSPSGDLRRFYEPIIQALVDTEGAFEINTAGLHKPCEEQYPATGFLSLAAEANIPVYLNSDAHYPDEVARDFSSARKVAAQAGLTEIAHLCEKSSSLVAG